MATFPLTSNSVEASRTVKALGFSILLHLLLLLGISIDPHKAVEKPLQIKLVSPPIRKLNTKQPPRIVSPSKARETHEAPETNQLSDKNRLAQKQQIKRGVINPSPPEAQQPAIVVAKQALSAPKPSAPQPQVSESKTTKTNKAVKTPNLRLAPQDIAKKISIRPTPKPTAATEKEQDPKEIRLSQKRMLSLLKARPFERLKAQNQSLGAAGIPDYLPDIPDGDITLLNAKADRFAIFVRRVALQVFGAIRQKNWQEIPINEIHRLRHFSTIHAVMNTKGELISVEIAQSSGSRPFDIVVNDSAKKGTWDQNPPKGAEAEDGNIHFIFKARSWARGANQGIGEQRWLLLGTGLL